MLVAQFILDCFPDCIAEYGLIGCGLSLVIAADLIALAYFAGKRILSRMA